MVAVVYTSLVALVQQDMKKLIAYSSVAHMAIVTIGLFTFNQQGIEGAIIVMLSHGLVSGALFLCVGVIYDRLHTREISRYGGLSVNMPKYALLFMLFTMASVGLPGTSGFVGEFLSIIGTFKASKATAIFAAFGVILGACYMLWLYKRVWFSEVTNHHIDEVSDLGRIEFISLGLMAVFVVLLGILPNLVLSYFELPVSSLVKLFLVK
jgi:NADH-quinone oxidoreductase subunit M